MTYDAQVWAPTKIFWNKIETAQNSKEMSTLNVKRIDKIRLTKIEHCLKINSNLIKTAKKRDWARYILRKKLKHGASKITFWQIRKRKEGQQKTRWRDGFSKLLTHDMFHRIAQDRLQ